MASSKLFSIIVPAYNAENTIQRTLASVLSQTGASFEVIIIDDGSTDQTAPIVFEAASRDSRVRVVQQTKNTGHGSSRNRGIDEASGEYLVFVDADDELLPEAISRIALELESEAYDLLLIGVVEERRNKQRTITSAELLLGDRDSRATDVNKSPQVLFWPPATWSKVYKREFLNREAIRFPPGFHQDIPWSVESTLKAHSIGVLAEPCYLYIRRGSETSTTNKMTERTLVRVQQVERIRKRISVFELPKQVQEHLVALVSIHLIWGNRAAYRTIPVSKREGFFHDSAREMMWWWGQCESNRSVKSEPLMATAERNYFTRALLTESWPAWQSSLALYRLRTKLKRYLDPKRWGLSK